MSLSEIDVKKYKLLGTIIKYANSTPIKLNSKESIHKKNAFDFLIINNGYINAHIWYNKKGKEKNMPLIIEIDTLVKKRVVTDKTWILLDISIISNGYNNIDII